MPSFVFVTIHDVGIVSKFVLPHALLEAAFITVLFVFCLSSVHALQPNDVK